MPFGKGRRKLFWALGFLLAGFAMLWLSLPLWFAWILRPLAAKAGARFSQVQRLGYGRFALQNLEVTNPAVTVRATRLTALVPSVWLWKLCTRTQGSTPYLRLENWDCELLPSRNTNSSPVVSQVHDTAAVLTTLRHWIPLATFSRGAVRSGKTVLTIHEASWADGRLQARVQLPSELAGNQLELHLSPARPFQVDVDWPELRLTSTMLISTNQLGLDINNSTVWRSNRFELQAHFGPKAELPDTAILQGSKLLIPGELIKLPQYPELAGSVVGRWEHGQFELDLTAAAKPAATLTNLPPVDLSLRARGNTNLTTIEQLTVKLPFAEASLSTPATLAFTAPYLQSPTRLRMTADLARQQWLPLSGTVTGVVDVSTTAGKAPSAKLRLGSSGVGTEAIKASTLELNADFSWPLLQVTSANARFDDGSAASLSGTVDLESNSVSGVQFQAAGALASRWLPPGYSYGKLAVSGTIEGPIERPAHAGHLQADQVITPMLQPLTVSAEWSGVLKTLNSFQVQLATTNSSVVVQGALSLESERSQLQLTSLALSTNGVAALELAQPVSFAFTMPTPETGWGLNFAGFRWAGASGEVRGDASIQWPHQGAVQFSIQRFPIGLFAGFTTSDIPSVSIQDLHASADWTNGPVSLGVDFSGTGVAKAPRAERAGTPEPFQGEASPKTQVPSTQPAAEAILSTPLSLALKANADAQGLVISNLLISSPTSKVVVAHGFLPVTFTPGLSNNVIQIDPERPVGLNAAVRPEAFFWEHLAQLTGVRLEQPNLNVDLSGSWKDPRGQVTVQASSIKIKAGQPKQPTLQDLHLALLVNRDEARLTEGRLMVQGQRISLSAKLPLGESAWTDLAHKKLPDWKQGSATVQVKDAHLAAFEPLFPDILAPEGDLDLNVKLLPGLNMEGALDIRHARTRPLGNTAPLRDINVTLRVRDRILALENASTSLSGAQVSLSGRVDLRGTNWLSGGLPPFELALLGTNVPLAREPEYIIRSDLDLKIAKTNGAPPIVLGAAHLRDSYYLSDLAALVPSGVSKPSSRPPYFSIDNATLANWRLAVTVDGVRWLKLRTSLFDGEVSANLHLQGTLEEPVVLGGIKIDSGLVRFPFGNLDVQQGLLTLSSQDPYHPTLLVRAASKQFGYDIHMEVSGPIDVPIIQFTSNPSLSSEQILLMLTAGQMPQGTYTLTPQQRAQTVALFLGRDLLAKLGLSDQTQERLTIRSGEEISDQGHPTYHVEYKLTPRWYVVGEYDRFGDFNGGFKWRIYSK